MITFAAKNEGNVSIRDIQLKVLWGYCWLHGLPYIETFLSLMEVLIKSIITDVFPHQQLSIDYNISSNDSFKEANYVEIIFNKIMADDMEFQVLGDLIFQGDDNRSFIRKITSHWRKVNKNMKRVI